MNVERTRSFTNSQIERVIKQKKKSSFVKVAKELLMKVEDVKFIWKNYNKKLKFEASQREKPQQQSQEDFLLNCNFGEVDLRKKNEENDLSEEGQNYSVNNDNFDNDLDETSQSNYEGSFGDSDEADVLMDQEPQTPNTPTVEYYGQTIKFIQYVQFLENEYSKAQEWKDALANAHHEKQKLVKDLDAANEKKQSIKTLFLEQKLELEEVKKKNDDLCRKLAANRAKCHYDSDENVCVGCEKKLVFNVGNMVVCRCCADGFRTQISIGGPPAANA